MARDTGYAPEIKNKICKLKGCKKRTIEKNAKKGDWIIGIGGKTLGKTKNNQDNYHRKLIYAMKVQIPNPPQSEEFSFFGENAREFPEELQQFLFQKNWRTKYFIDSRDKKNYNELEAFVKRLPKDEHGEHCDLPMKKNKCKC